MKRRLFCLALTLAIIISVFSTVITAFADDTNGTDTDSFDDFPFTIDGDVSEDAIKTAKEQWNMIPRELKDIIINNGVTIIFTDKEAEDYFPYCTKKIVAFYNPLKKIIVYESKNPSILSATIHEVGHALDDAFGYPSYSKEFTEIFEAEKDILPGVHSDLACEFFADVFKLCIKAHYNPLVKGELDRLPRAKAYMEKLFNLSKYFDEDEGDLMFETEEASSESVNAEIASIIDFIKSFFIRRD